MSRKDIYVDEDDNNNGDINKFTVNGNTTKMEFKSHMLNKIISFSRKFGRALFS